MTRVLLASDAPWVRADVEGSLLPPDFAVHTVDSGEKVLPAIGEFEPDALVLDLQIGKMGAAAIAGDVRNEREEGRIGPLPILVLLDREADQWLMGRVGADAWLVKPIPPGRLANEVRKLAK